MPRRPSPTTLGALALLLAPITAPLAQQTSDVGPPDPVRVPTPGGAVVSVDAEQHRRVYEVWHYAPARIEGELVFVSGIVAGAAPGDTLDVAGFERALRRAFSRLRATLAAAGSSTADLVDLTTYHVFDAPHFRGSKGEHIAAVQRVKDEFVPAPYPAWTGVGVTALFPEGGLVEIRAVARRAASPDTPPGVPPAESPAALVGRASAGGSLRFGASEPRRYEFADQRLLPPTFGRGEFTLDFWIRPDTTFPVGPTTRGTLGQLANWSSADPRPGSRGWWLAGNWLLDGFSRPEGFGPDDTRAGSVGLQLYGGGRIRWLLADGERMPADSVLGVQAWPASSTPSLLDGRWHHVACVRRWNEATGGATLELWVDGRRIATTESPRRTDLRRWWDRPPHPRTPAPLGGWAWGSEVMTAWGVYFTQYEDYKGELDELRFWDRALTPEELAAGGRAVAGEGAPGLVGWFAFDETAGSVAHDRLDGRRTIRLHPVAGASMWHPAGAPVPRTR